MKFGTLKAIVLSLIIGMCIGFYSRWLSGMSPILDFILKLSIFSFLLINGYIIFKERDRKQKRIQFLFLFCSIGIGLLTGYYFDNNIHDSSTRIYISKESD